MFETSRTNDTVVLFLNNKKTPPITDSVWHTSRTGPTNVKFHTTLNRVLFRHDDRHVQLLISWMAPSEFSLASDRCHQLLCGIIKIRKKKKKKTRVLSLTICTAGTKDTSATSRVVSRFSFSVETRSRITATTSSSDKSLKARQTFSYIFLAISVLLLKAKVEIFLSRWLFFTAEQLNRKISNHDLGLIIAILLRLSQELDTANQQMASSLNIVLESTFFTPSPHSNKWPVSLCLTKAAVKTMVPTEISG